MTKLCTTNRTTTKLGTTKAMPLYYKATAIQGSNSTAMAIRTFTAILYKEEDMYIAECPEVGTVDQGETIEEALSNLQEATRLYLEASPMPEISPRFITKLEVNVA
jgi:predicted RNase H-like HicB family nuclease